MSLTATRKESNGRDWYQEFGIKARRPRIEDGLNQIEELLKKCSTPEVAFKPGKVSTEIVFRFPTSHRQFPMLVGKVFGIQGSALRHAFEVVMWEKPRKGKPRLWARATNLAYEAYRATWLQALRSTYLGCFHPIANETLRILIDTARGRTKRAAGRRTETKAERESLMRRYRELLVICREIHSAADTATKQTSATRNSELRRSGVRKRIWEGVKRQVYGTRLANDIFTQGTQSSFANIPHGRKEPTLDTPDLWKPQQLAIALVGIERGLV